ncbi:MAG: polysaccharide biosynthesis C-terminal domain-containing protein [Clostridia bacterium]|nr:polysaccharide biosynthesis C-terminal domain-containing protein [Clostridia bacterium]
MKLVKQFIINGLILTVTSVTMRLLTVAFNVYITDKVGAAGVGLFSLIMSVYAFAVTFATSGISLSATRLVSQQIVRNSGKGVRSAMIRCILYSLVFGITGAVLLFSFSGIIASNWLGDIRALRSLKILAFSLPPLAVSAALSGYFSAVRRVAKNAVTNILEQFIRIFFTAALLVCVSGKGIEAASVAIVTGILLSEFLSFAVSFVLYLFDIRRVRDLTAPPSSDLTGRLIKMAVPIAVSSYIRSALVTLEHLLIPKGLIKNGKTSTEALSSYGVISGMVFPVIFFPMAFLTAFTGLIVPEITRYKETKSKKSIEYVTGRIMKITVIFSVAAAGFFAYYSDTLGMLLYDSAEAGRYIRIFAFLIPVMYIDNTTDAVLKGLGEQFASMRYNIIDALVSVILVFFLLPPFGIKGYVLVIYICEILNAALSIRKLLSCVKLKLNLFKTIFMPFVCMAGAACLTKLIFVFLNINYDIMIITLIVGFAVLTVLYILLLRCFGCISNDDKTWFLNIFKKNGKKSKIFVKTS